MLPLWLTCLPQARGLLVNLPFPSFQLNLNERSLLFSSLVPNLDQSSVLFMDSHFAWAEVDNAVVKEKAFRRALKGFHARATPRDYQAIVSYLYSTLGSEEVYSRFMQYLGADSLEPYVLIWLDAQSSLSFAHLRMTAEWIKLTPEQLSRFTKENLSDISGDYLLLMEILAMDEHDGYQPIIHELMVRLASLTGLSLEILATLWQILQLPRAPLLHDPAQVQRVFHSDYLHDVLLGLDVSNNVISHRLFYWAMANFEPRLYPLIAKILKSMEPAPSENLKLADSGPTALLVHVLGLRPLNPSLLGKIIGTFDLDIEDKVYSARVVEPILRLDYGSINDVELADILLLRKYLNSDQFSRYVAYPLASHPPFLTRVLQLPGSWVSRFFTILMRNEDLDPIPVLRSWLHQEGVKINSKLLKSAPNYMDLLRRVFAAEMANDVPYLHPLFQAFMLSTRMSLFEAAPTARLVQVVLNNPESAEHLLDVVRERVKRGEICLECLHLSIADDDVFVMMILMKMMQKPDILAQIMANEELRAALLHNLQSIISNDELTTISVVGRRNILKAVVIYELAEEFVEFLFRQFEPLERPRAWLEIADIAKPAYLLQTLPMIPSDHSSVDILAALLQSPISQADIAPIKQFILSHSDSAVRSRMLDMAIEANVITVEDLLALLTLQ